MVGPLTSEITVIISDHLYIKCAKSAKTRSILGTRIRQWMTGTAERICAKEDVLGHSLGLVWMSTSKVKGHRSRSPGTKTRCGRNGMPSLQITSRKQQARRFDRCRGVSSQGCVRWTWRTTAGLCHAFLVFCGDAWKSPLMSENVSCNDPYTVYVQSALDDERCQYVRSPDSAILRKLVN